MNQSGRRVRSFVVFEVLAIGALAGACARTRSNDPPAPAPAGTEVVKAALNASPKTSDFIFEAANSIVLHSAPLTVNGGDVGARGTGSGPFLSGGVAIDISSGAVVQATHNTIADSIKLNTGIQVGDLQVNRLVNPSSGTHGSVTPLVPLPALPAPAAVTPGTTNLTVAGGKTVTASPGQFLTVSLGTSAVLRLNAGTYQMKDLTIGTSGRIEALGAVQIRVANRLSAASSFFIGPATSATTLTAKDIRIEVSGKNGTDGALGSTPKAAALGSNGSIRALVLVPNGTLTFATGICAKGAFLARDIDVGSSNAAYAFEDGFPSGATCTPAGCDDHNPCTTDGCAANGTCTHTNVVAGTLCSDGNACNGTETCNGSGACQTGAPVTCTPLDSCHVAGTCDPTSGTCTDPVAANGAACNDGNPCTRTDTCQAGTCTGANPVVCAASDQCHAVGMCDATTGVCSNPSKPNGTTCSDGNACTQTDTCQAGTCTGSNPIVCMASDQCHDIGICDTGTGACSNPAKPNGAPCSDGNSCTQTDTCQTGTCTGSNPVTCVALDQCHDAGTCNPTTGVCSNVPKANGAPCNDGNACTQTDTCQTGTCTAGSPLNVDDHNPCTTDSCAPATGAAHVPVAAGTGCANGLPCSGAEVCDGHGICIPVDDGNSCTLDVCDPGQGLSHVPAAAGTPCTSSASCGGAATCDGAGTCSACAVGSLKLQYGSNDVPSGGVVTVPAVLADSRGVVIPLTLTNVGNGDVTLSGTPNVTISGPDAADFSIQQFPPGTLASGKSVTIEVKFAPSATGTRTASLQIVSNDLSNSPFVLTLTATGLSPADLNPNTNGDFAAHTAAACNTREARVMVRTGDIDNLGFGFPVGFDPFAGLNTPSHSYPWAVDPNDPAGTDRIFIGSSFAGGCNDGYCGSTTRPATLPQCIALTMELPCADGTVPSSGLIQMFVDDFQPRVFGSLFQVTINGKRATQIEDGMNLLAQTGPIGKLVTFTLTPDQLAVLKPGVVNICVDDPTTGRGDGYAIDFAKLLVDVYGTDKKGTITGTVADSRTGVPIAGATVSAGGVVTSTTDANGIYTLASVPAGFVFLYANASGYETHGQVIDLPDGQTDAVNIPMNPNAPPVVTSTPVTQVLVNSTYSYKVVAVDPDGDSLTWGIPKNKPPGMSINEFTGQITWSPTADQIGSWPISVEVNDRRGGVTVQSFTITVGAANMPPTVNCQPDVHLTGSSATVTISCPVTDDGKLNATPTLQWSSSFKGTAPPMLTPNGDRADVVLSAPGIYQFSVTASDGEFEVLDSVIVTLSPSTNTGITVFAGADQAITTLTTNLTGTAIGGSGALLVSWSQIDGPTTAEIASPADETTAISFTRTGTYAFRFTATDGLSIDSDDIQVIVVPTSGTGADGTQGWIGSPLSQTNVHGLVPVTVAEGVTVTSGTVSYWPVANPADVHVLTDTAAGGPGATLATLDTTALRNGSFVIDLTARDSHGDQLESDVLVAVDGDYKPGRKVVEVIDFTVPVAGIPITVGRRYDSLEKDLVGDFGNGWSLTVGHPDLQVDPFNDVTITLPDGRRATFLFGLTPPVVGPVILGFLGYPTYVPAPGVFGKLASDGCFLLSFNPSNPDPICFGAIDMPDPHYHPTTFQYTDPYGVVYTMGADGALKSIQDRNNNILTFTPGGIVSEPSGQTVAFTRDAQGRITKILTPAQFAYTYAYDASGNLVAATQPPQNTFTQVSTYTYDGAHRLLTTTDPAGHQKSSTYDAAGRLASSTDAMANVTGYAYDVPGHTTTTTYPDTGVVTEKFDDNGMLLARTDQLGRTTLHEYDANRNETKRTNALGEVTVDAFDTNGNRTSSKNAAGETTTATYDAFSNPLTITDPVGNTRTFAYDDTGALKSVRDGMGTLLTATSSEQGLPTSVTDAAGNKVALSYDATGALIGRTDRLGRLTAYAYDAMGRKTAAVDPRGGVTSYSYDQDGDVTFTQNPMGFGPLVRYDAARNVQQIQDLNGSVTRSDQFTYDANNHLTNTRHDHDGTEIRQTVDFRASVLSRTDEAGHSTSYTYDLAGQLVKTTYPDGTVTTQTYDALGRLQTKTDERGNTATYAYQPGCDCTDRMTAVTDPLGRTTSMLYDGMGRKTSVTDANGHKTVYIYDARGQLIETDYPDGTATLDTYDDVGRRTASRDQTGAKTLYGYDAEGQLVSVTDPLGNVTRYGYDANGNLTSLTDANNHVTTYAYDAANRKISRTLPLGMTERFGYDADGNVISHTDFRGKTTSYIYDARRKGGRLVSKVPDPSLGEPTNSYVYNLNSTRASMSDASGATSYAYDLRNRVLTKATPAGNLTYSYDAAGNVATVRSSNANGTSVDYVWDAANQLSSVTDNRAGGTTTTAYTPTKRPFTITQPNGVGSRFFYDSLDRVTSMTWRGASTDIASWSYTHNARGQRLTSTDITGRAATYTYDGAARLATETVTGDLRGAAFNGAFSYVLDNAGNRLSRASALAAIASATYGYDANDQLTSDAYDANGNTTSSGGHTYTYDFENRLLSKDGGTVALLYNCDGDRVAKTVPGVMTHYLVDELNPTGYLQVLEEVANGAVQTRYTYGTRLVSQTRDVPSTPVTSYFGYDAHGNMTFLTDPTGSITDSYDYDAFGILIASTGSTPNRRLFAGEEFDPDLGFLSLRARNYSADRGRFTTSDPAPGDLERPISFNRYAYAGVDPVNKIDPSGMSEALEYAWIAYESTAEILGTSPTSIFDTLFNKLNHDVHLDLVETFNEGAAEIAKCHLAYGRGLVGVGELIVCMFEKVIAGF